MLIYTAVVRLNNKIGIKNEIPKMNFERKVAEVACQIFFCFVLTDSSEMCIPNESDNASAIAITITPDITTSLEFVEKFKPINKPKVVIMPDVKPKLKPCLIALFIK